MNKEPLLIRLDELRWLRYRLARSYYEIEDLIGNDTGLGTRLRDFYNFKATVKNITKLKEARKEVHRIFYQMKIERKVILGLLSNPQTHSIPDPE